MPEQNGTFADNQNVWNEHYRRIRSQQEYPDENLVRLLKNSKQGAALDFGCGSGRHVKLLAELGFAPVSAYDMSKNAVEMCRRLYDFAKVRQIKTENGTLCPEIPDGSQNVAVLWGVLHYNSPADIANILVEMKRVLSKNGEIFGTLRAKGDTHFSENPDMDQANIDTFSSDETMELLRPFFPNVQLGYMERTPVGELSRHIRHWIFAGRR